MGEKTDEFLTNVFTDSYKRETDADEAIWRSLPFFLALLGLAVSALPPVVRGALHDAHGGWAIGAWFFLAAAALSFLYGGWAFLRVIRIREYRYLPPDADVLAYADQVAEAYGASGMDAASVDQAVHADVRRLVLEELAAATTTNRAHNDAKAKARSQVLLAATAGFLLALGAEIMVLGAQATAPYAESLGGDEHATQRAGEGAADKEGGGDARLPQAGPPQAPDRGGGRKLRPDVEGPADSAGQMNESKAQPQQPPKPVAAKPERPQPVYLNKSLDPKGERKG